MIEQEDQSPPNSDAATLLLTDHVRALVDVQGLSADYFLQRLVSMVNGGSISIPITLHVEGQIISGQLIGGRQYFNEWAEAFAAGSSTDENDRKELRTLVASFGDVYKPEEIEKAQTEPQFIHIRNARVYHSAGKPVPANEGVLWRGRINAVSGFNLGALSHE